jgi:hypothetical protein
MKEERGKKDDVGILSFGGDGRRKVLLEEDWRCVNEEPLPTSPNRRADLGVGEQRLG